MVIQPKKKPVIRKGSGYFYKPETFAEHAIDKFQVVDTPEELLAKIEPFEFMGRRFVTFDTETHPYYKTSQDVPSTHVRRWVGSGKHATPQDFPFCISVCDGKNCYTMFDTAEDNFSKLRGLAPLFEDPSIEMIAHNTKFDMHMLANAGCKLVGKVHDTVVLAKLVDENRKSYRLRDLAAKYEGGIEKFEYMVDSYKSTYKVSDYRDIPVELLAQYANADVWNCYLTFVNEYPRLVEEELEALYDKELEVMVVLYAMERYGMRVDNAYESELKQDLQRLCDEAEQAIYDEAGRLFNINSTKQLYGVLMELGVNPTLIACTDKGNPKLDKKALNNLAEQHKVSIVSKILEFRKYDKLLTTYAVGIYDQRDAADRVHGSINQTEATTGRMSITKPALQTLPKKDVRIRSAFVPSDGYSLWFMDLDQVEYRLFSHYAKIPSLIEQIHEGYDVHTATAATLFNKDMDELTRLLHEGDKEASALRSRAKTLNFALIYGMGNQALANDLKVPLSEAVDIKTRYFGVMPEARTFIDSVQSVIKMRGWIKNFYGRKRRLDPDDCYKAPNSLIQGCAADYIKHKLVDMYKYIMANGLNTRMVNIVHDEIVFEVDESEQAHLPKLRWLMSDFSAFRCPITAGAERGAPSWGQKEESEIGFTEPDNFDFLNYDVFNGSVFKEV